MIVSAVIVKLLVLDSHSLKAKRSVINSLKQRIRNKFNVSVAEDGEIEKHNYSEIGLTAIGGENKFVEESISKAVQLIRNDVRVEVIDVNRII